MARRRDGSQLTLVLVIGASLSVGCKAKEEGASKNDAADDDVGFVEDASDTAAAEIDAQLVTSSLVSSSAPDTLGDGVRAIYFPQGCLRVESDAAAHTVTYAFDGCVGPNGLRDVRGEVKAKYDASPAHLRLELTANALSINDASVDWAATADITSVGSDRTLRWKAQLSGTTAGGRTFDRANDHAIGWKLGEPCFAVDGVSQGRVNGREIRTEIEGFRRCRRACPDAGGTIVVTNVTKNRRFELHYDGTNQATFVGPRGRDVSIPLLCAQ